MTYPVHYVPAGDVLPIFFDTYDGGTGASVTMTGLAVTDIEIYKDGGVTQRASDAGYTLLDTDGIDFDGITGIHGFSIDTGDNTDAGFYTVGAWFHVVVSAVTVDAQTVNFIAAAFRLMAAESVAAKPKVDVDAWLGTAAATPTTAGVPEVDVTHIAGSAVSTSTAQLGVNVVNAAGTAWGSGAITAAAIATGAIDADAVAADAATEIANAVWDTDATARQTQGTFGQAIGDPGADTNTIYGAVVTGAAGATIAADIIAVKAETAAIVADTGTDGVVVAAASKTGYTLSAAGLADFFDTDSGTTYASAVAGSVVKEIADNAGGSALTEAGIAAAVWDLDATGHQTQGTFGQAIGDPAADTGTIYKAVVTDATGATVGVDVVDLKTQIGVAGAGLTAINLPDQTMNITGDITGSLSGSVGSVTGAVGSVTGAVGSVTGAVGSVAGNVDGNVTGTVAGVTPATAAQVAALLTTQITESYRANAAAPTLAQFMSEVLAHLGEAAIAGTTKTINKLDHATAAATFTLDDATTPTSITRAT